MQDENEDRPDTSGWSQSLQFLWAILKDRERFRRLVVLIILVIVIGLVFKGSIEAFVYTLAQHLPSWAKTAALIAGVGGGVGGSVGWPVYRKVYRKSFRLRSRKALTGEEPSPKP